MKKTVLFVPSNQNHARIFSTLSNSLNKTYNVLFLTQDHYKNEGSENELNKLGIKFKPFKQIHKDPIDILKEENVGVLVIGNDTDVIPQWFVNSANQIGIPSVLIQDGLFFDVATKQYRPKIKSNLKLILLTIRLLLLNKYHRVSDGHGGCTQIHVWGKKSQNYFIQKGVQPDKIFVTGRIMRGTNQEIGCSKSKDFTVLLARTNLLDSKLMSVKDYLRTLDELISVVSDYGIRLIIKPHPIDVKHIPTITKYQNSIMMSNKNITELLCQCNVLITDLSTVCIQALEKNIPVIIFFPSITKLIDQSSFPNDLIHKNIVMLAENKNELYQCIGRILDGSFILNHDALIDTLSDYVGSYSTNPIENSTKLIIKLLDS